MISIIVAMTEGRLIGRDGGIPWHLPGDLKLFKELTIGSSIIMGRKTYQSLKKPLTGRLNVVISSTLKAASRGTESDGDSDVLFCTSFREALDAAGKRNSDEIFIIGGTEIYRAALPVAEKLYISRVEGNYEGDTYFPDFSEEEWEKTSSTPFEGFVLEVYKRKLLKTGTK